MIFGKIFKKKNKTPLHAQPKETLLETPEAVRMPKMSDNMTEALVTKWLVETGDVIKNGDILAEVETDKATMELESYVFGTVLHLGCKDGETMKANQIIAIIGNEGDGFSHLLES